MLEFFISFSNSNFRQLWADSLDEFQPQKQFETWLGGSASKIYLSLFQKPWILIYVLLTKLWFGLVAGPG